MKYSEILCPICSSIKNIDLSANLHICGICHTAFNSEHMSLTYDDNYFLDDYKKQYGKTYPEDFNNISKISNKRLKVIYKLITSDQTQKDLTLLDIGSAMGFFLKCAKDSGIKNVTGIEISEFASSYCKDEFNIDVINSSLENVEISGPFDIITAWFFIEHCHDPVSVINKIYNSIKDRGIFAFSTTSTYGPLFRFNKNEWIKSHPKDHRIDITPSSIKKILRDRGFKKVYTKPCGIHPERIVSKNSIFYRPFSFVYKLFSNITSFSDTIEVYALK